MTNETTLSSEDTRQITNILYSVAYLLDAHDYDRLAEVFSTDIHFDNPGRLSVDGINDLIDAFHKITDPAISHHITNPIITPHDADSAHATSKALTIRSDKTLAAAEYTDVLKKTQMGWRITSREIRPLS